MATRVWKQWPTPFDNSYSISHHSPPQHRRSTGDRAAAAAALWQASLDELLLCMCANFSQAESATRLAEALLLKSKSCVSVQACYGGFSADGAVLKSILWSSVDCLSF